MMASASLENVSGDKSREQRGRRGDSVQLGKRKLFKSSERGKKAPVNEGVVEGCEGCG